MIGGGAVSWKSSKQETTADSTTEAEYITASEEQRKQFGSRSSLLNLVWFLALLVQYPCIVTTMAPLHRQRNQGLISDPNMFLGATICVIPQTRACDWHVASDDAPPTLTT